MASFNEILDNMKRVHEAKNKDYGNSFSDNFKDWGVVSAIIRLDDKMRRLKSLYKNGGNEVKDEAMEDTLLDLANYAVMTLEELTKNNN